MELNDMSGSVKTTKQQAVSNPLEHVISSELSSADEEEIKDKLYEFQQVASLLVMDIKSHAEIAERKPEMAIKALEALKESMERIISDEEWRNRRFNACVNINKLVRNSF